MRFKPNFYPSFCPLVFKWWYFNFTLLSIGFRGLQWKDKYKTPRIELIPIITIIILNIKFEIIFGNYDSWEKYLIKKYY